MDTVKALKAADGAERAVFARMIDMNVEVESARKIISYWMYLESSGCKNLVKTIASRDDQFMSLLCAEAGSALTCLQSPDSVNPISSTSPMTLSLGNPSFSLYDIVQDRERFSRGVSEFYNGVCSSVFEDILEKRSLMGGEVEDGNENGKVGGEVEDDNENGKGKGKGKESNNIGTEIGGVRTDGEGISQEGAQVVPGGGAAGSGGTSTATDGGRNSIVGSGSGSRTKLNPNAEEWRPLDDGSNDSRCLFITFSNGFPLSHNQIYLFFTWKFGPYVEKIYIHQPWDSAPLFGKITFKTSLVPALILNGKDQVRFYAFGRTIWCKRYNRRNRDV